jgi:hypothetical protein
MPTPKRRDSQQGQAQHNAAGRGGQPVGEAQVFDTAYLEVSALPPDEVETQVDREYQQNKKVEQ